MAKLIKLASPKQEGCVHIEYWVDADAVTFIQSATIPVDGQETGVVKIVCSGQEIIVNDPDKKVGDQINEARTG